MLVAQTLSCRRGERTLFSGLDLRAGPGVCIQVEGDNGAGKTSLLRILCGLMLPAGGQVLWDGRDIRSQREEFASVLCYVGHLNGIKDDLTAIENLRFAARMAGGDVSAAGAALARLGLAGRETLAARVLSQGQKRRVALARLLLAPAARLWVLDEPFTALDAIGVATLASMIGAHADAGGVVVFTTHQPVTLHSAVQRIRLEGAETYGVRQGSGVHVAPPRTPPT